MNICTHIRPDLQGERQILSGISGGGWFSLRLFHLHWTGNLRGIFRWRR